MDDEPMWTADRVVSSTPGSVITIPKTINEFAIKGNHLTLVKGNQFDDRTKIDPHKRIHEFLEIYDMFKHRDTKNEVVRLMMFLLSLTGEAKTYRFFPPSLFDRLLEETRAFSQHENESLINAWIRMKEMLRNCHGHNLSKGNIIKIFYHGLNKITQEVLNAAAGGIFLYKTPNQAYQLHKDKVLLKLDWAKNQKTKSSLKKTIAFTDECNNNSDTDKIMARMDAMTIKMDAQYKELQSRAKQLTPILTMMTYLCLVKKRLNSCKLSVRLVFTMITATETRIAIIGFQADGMFTTKTTIDPTPIKNVAKNHQASIQNLETKFDRLADKQSGRPSRSLPSNTQPNPRGNNPKAYQPPQSRNEHVNAVFTKSVIRVKQKQLNLGVGTERMIFNIDSAIKHSYLNDDTCFSIDIFNEILEEDFDALPNEWSKILHSIEGTILEEEIFSKFDKFIAMALNENYNSESDEEEPKFKKITINTDYKLKTSLEEPLTDLELKPLPDNLEYVFLEEPSFLSVIISSQVSAQNKSKLVSVLKNIKMHLPGKQQTFLVFAHHSANTRYNFWMTKSQLYFQNPIDPMDQEKTTFTCPFDTYAYRRMPFGLCNAPTTFQRCILAIFHDMIEESVEVFIDDFSVFGNSFDKCLNNLDKMLQRCKDAYLVLNWENVTTMVKEGIMIGHSPNWNLSFELICDASDFAVGAVLGQKDEFDIEIKDKKGTENVVSDHLSQIDNNETSDDIEVGDNFPEETLMEINTRDEPKLDDALWAFRTAYKTPTGTTPYKLIYGKNCHLPFEIEHRAYRALKNCNPDLIAAGEKEIFYAEFLKKSHITQEVSRRAVDLKEIQDEDTSLSKITSEIPMEVEGFEPPQEEVIPICRSERTHRVPNRLCLNVEVEEHGVGDLNEPTSYKAAMLDPESNKWLDAMNAEMQSMIDNNVWVLVDLPPNSRLVAKGYTQLYRVDYEEMFSPVADFRAIRILISIAAFYDYEI
ncbi:reverse transcriptase domain-containing protein [Tanacetum coccineum]|uniref:Reverse transcriptase domain-containing protein n=1 Tax=Tanacetum coccineum TaxID=301880 RepID=A0ABQ4Z5I3_9ASTR